MQNLLIMLLVASGIFVGCSRNEESLASSRPRGQDSAVEVLRKMQKSLLSGDERAYRECFKGSPQALRLAKAGFRAAKAQYAFDDKFSKKFGQETWEESEIPDRIRVSVPPQSETWVETLSSKTEEDGAVRFDGPGLLGGGVRVYQGSNGVWWIDADSLITQGADVGMLTRMFEAIASALTELTDRINQGIELAELDRVAQEKAQKILGIMMSAPRK